MDKIIFASFITNFRLLTTKFLQQNILIVSSIARYRNACSHCVEASWKPKQGIQFANITNTRAHMSRTLHNELRFLSSSAYHCRNLRVTWPAIFIAAIAITAVLFNSWMYSNVVIIFDNFLQLTNCGKHVIRQVECWKQS